MEHPGPRLKHERGLFHLDHFFQKVLLEPEKASISLTKCSGYIQNNQNRVGSVILAGSLAGVWLYTLTGLIVATCFTECQLWEAHVCWAIGVNAKQTQEAFILPPFQSFC